ncbi:glycerate kinase type-2 family protein [Pararhodospirillum photometricum]|uniref:Hydroxypyruvate reductase n=1 Tax=Pararhodospirillum photometricum DSM 122 TaxID=1150469 RepID=H6SRW1_PARPM|nr:glycerate kinase [Pararhodospirillum photometricum]CCG07640.1 Hydroxypyruvate reductase [Pararhodospirillum photometricum DSM 122]
MDQAPPLRLLRALFDAAVAAADPALVVPPHLPPRPVGRTVVVGAGKAAAAMARAVDLAWDGPLSGLVVTRYGYGVPCPRLEVVEAGHPLPDSRGTEAARRILALASSLGPDDLLLCLISGGASALLALPPPDLSLEDKRAVTAALLRSGAPIQDINTVRRHLSLLKGGRLAAAARPARVVTLLISDVPGDDPTVIGSGPTVADASTPADALDILCCHGISEPERVLRFLATRRASTPDAQALERTETVLVATPRQALVAAAEVARHAGVTPLILGDALEGEAREVARALAPMALSCARFGDPAAPPCVLLSGGELTVTVQGAGRGGPNSEFALALARALDGAPSVWALAGDTDGIDGTETNAGAIVTPDTLARARRRGLSARGFLADNDAYSFFAALDDLVITGPTLTNVNDFRAILIAPA